MFGTNGEEHEKALEPGIEVREEFEELSLLAQKIRSSEKRWGKIGKVLAVLALFLWGRVALRDLSSIMEGEISVWYMVNEMAGLIFAGCALVYAYLDVVVPIVNVKKNSLADECLKLMTVKDRQALKNAVSEMHCQAVKSVYLDENGNVCVQGKRCKHIFQEEEGVLTLVPAKETYKTALEKESIAGCLLKYLSSDAPVNAYEKERYNSRLSKLNYILAALATVSAGVFLFFGVRSDLLEGSDKYVRMVVSGHPGSYPDISYGDAFDAFFENCEWSYFKSDQGQDVVEFHGRCFSDGEKKDVDIQFLLSVEDGTFELYASAIDGEFQTEFENGLLLITIFESYGTGDGIGTMP